jgi:hypothetical protein
VTHNKSGLKRALQWHLGVVQVQGKSQVGTVLSGGKSLCIPAFIRM